MQTTVVKTYFWQVSADILLHYNYNFLAVSPIADVSLSTNDGIAGLLFLHGWGAMIVETENVSGSVCRKEQSEIKLCSADNLNREG